jgi:hypothetical protein
MQYLKGAGERLDSEIAANTGLSLANVRQRMSELSAKGEIILCHSIRYVDGKKVEGTLCRIAGYMPPASPGRKPKPRTPVA